MSELKEKDYYQRRRGALITERQSFLPHYKELSEFVKPRRGRFLVTDRNKGDKRFQSIINSVATQCLKICVSGMLTGTMSPSRNWFSLEPFDKRLADTAGVRDWLAQVENILRMILASGNFYSQVSDLLSELILFGTGAMIHVDDFDDIARFYTKTVGSYALGLNERQEVDTFFEEYEWTAGQIVKKFGIENVSNHVKTAVDKGNYDKWYPICHFIEPNDEFRPQSVWAKDKAFKDVYYEPTEIAKEKYKYLKTGGFDMFPVYAPRWETTGSDIYGTDCPGMTALGDIKGLQIAEKIKAQGLQKQVHKPLQGPPGLRNVPVDALPGGLTIYDGDDSKQRLTSLYDVNLPYRDLREDMNAVEERIKKAFFVDLFLAISQMEGIQPRNELDLLTRNEERLLQLGPVLERLQGELLNPLIDRLFDQAVKADILPPAPEALQGTPIKTRYISTLAMAQRAVATQSIDRYFSFAGNLLSMGFNDVVYKINTLEAMDEYAKAIGVPPSIVVEDEDAEAARGAAMAKAEQAEALAAGQQMAGAAKDAAGAGIDVAGALDSALKNG